MDLAGGARVGPYEVTSPIGAGGMGEVYRARDTRLNRTVAIKILSRQFSSDPDRLSRFEREARTLATLNHPNIAQIYGTEREGDVHALAMEFVDGDDLSQILVHGPSTVDDAVAIARQIADALAAAHEHGIVHRDLKPANVKVRPDGTVKLLDFGLAKTTSAGDAIGASLPTQTSPGVTGFGAILGTAAYMSPEQAKGKTVDRATDMWAFGAVLYEMLAGRAAFAGETVTDVIAAIVTREPDWSALPATTPPALRRLLRRCLERDRHRRLADAGEARFQLEEVAASEPAPATEPVNRRSGLLPTLRPWAFAALFAVVVSLLATDILDRPASESARYSLEIPPQARLPFASRPAVAVSADGRTTVFVASVDGVERLFVRRTDSFDVKELPGTENGSNPAISPDGTTVAFGAGTRLAKVSIAGGPVTNLATIVELRGISWDEADSILYVPSPVSGVWRVPATGGQPSQMTKPGSPSERTHRYPQLLPGGALIFTIDTEATPDNYDDASIAALMPDGSRHTVLANASMARYVPSGHLLFARGGTLFASRFDPRRAEVMGSPTEILHEVAADLSTGAHHFAASQSETLVYISGRGAPGSTIPVWASVSGGIEPLSLPAGGYADLRLSPDGQQVAMTVIAGTTSDIWIHHVTRRSFTKMTFGGQNVTPLWSADGATLYYSEIDAAKGISTIMRRAADGSRQAEPVATQPGRSYLNGFMPGGRDLIVNIFGGEHKVTRGPRNTALMRLSLDPNAKPVSLIDDLDGFGGRVSPDGRWLAFTSPLPNREIYVRQLSGTGRWLVSPAGAEEPKWSPDGRRLYFRIDNQLMVVTVDPRAPSFESSLPTEVLKGIYNPRNESGISYDVDAKGDRFLMMRQAEEAADALSLRLITNWTTAVE
jgi:eukaryotic-like serine/threonine-protein kinase